MLVTSFDGRPGDCFDDAHVERCGQLFTRIHATPVAALRDVPLTVTDDPLDAVWSSGRPPDTDAVAIFDGLAPRLDRVVPALVHGDFSLANVLVARERLTVIDCGVGQRPSSHPRLDRSARCRRPDAWRAANGPRSKR